MKKKKKVYTMCWRAAIEPAAAAAAVGVVVVAAAAGVDAVAGGH